MKSRPRPRRIAKWTGLIACVLIVVAWAGVTSRGWGVAWYSKESFIVFGDGHLVVERFLASGQPDFGFWHWGVLQTGQLRYGFRWPQVQGLSSFRRWRVFLPLWLPLLVIAIPSALLWHRDRRRIPPGHCQQCGYDLTGNESGVCSECGETVAPAQ